MRRTFRDYVEDILTSFEETQEFTRGLEFDAFATIACAPRNDWQN